MSLSNFFSKYFTNYGDKRSLGFRFRQKRLALFMPLIVDAYGAHGEVNIIDIGGTKSYWKLLPDDILDKNNVHITIVNLPGSNLFEDEKHFRNVEADACNLSMFEDNSFHIAHSNSVIEHVGDWDRMKLFASELRRLSKIYYVQTPNYWFPIEPHFMAPFFHWLPKPISAWWACHMALGNWPKANDIDGAISMIESARLLNKSMFVYLFPEADIKLERYFFWVKSLIAIKA